MLEVPKLHVLDPKLAFWSNFIIVLKRISARNLKNTLKLSKSIIWRSTTIFLLFIIWFIVASLDFFLYYLCLCVLFMCCPLSYSSFFFFYYLMQWCKNKFVFLEVFLASFLAKSVDQWIKLIQVGIRPDRRARGMLDISARNWGSGLG